MSELRAIVGDGEDARRLAEEAKAFAPHLPLVHRQIRTLGPRDPAAIVESLDDELRHAPSPTAKLHATLYAADGPRGLGATRTAPPNGTISRRGSRRTTRGAAPRAGAAIAREGRAHELPR